MKHEYSRVQLRCYTVLALALSAVMFYAWAAFDSLPPRESLRTATGQIDWVKSDKYGVKFALQGSSRAYEYHSKANEMGAVESRLVNTREPITVLYDPEDPSGPIYSDEVFHDVYELSTPTGAFRSYEEIQAAYRSDNKIALWMSPIFFCMAIYLLVQAQRARR